MLTTIITYFWFKNCFYVLFKWVCLINLIFVAPFNSFLHFLIWSEHTYIKIFLAVQLNAQIHLCVLLTAFAEFCLWQSLMLASIKSYACVISRGAEGSGSPLLKLLLTLGGSASQKFCFDFAFLKSIELASKVAYVSRCGLRVEQFPTLLGMHLIEKVNCQLLLNYEEVNHIQ